MALKQLILSRKLQEKRASLEALRKKGAELKEKRSAMSTREAELEEAVKEITEETEEAVKAEVEAAVAEFEAEVAQVEADQAQTDQEIAAVEAEVAAIEQELQELTEKVTGPAPEEPGEEEARKERKVITMNHRSKFFGRSAEQVRSFLADNGVKSFIGEVRAAISEKRAITNAGLLIPDIMLGLVREEVARASKLLPFVDHRFVGGTGRMNIAGAIPEGIWTEMCANINELALSFNQVEVDGYKVGGYLAICNAVLEDSDIDLAAEIVSAISGAIAKALDKAILFGTGTKMPIGIATRLAYTSEPANWGAYAPAFTDLHTSNIIKLNIKANAGTAFFIALVEKLAVAKPTFTTEGLFWAMNRKTHLDILAKALEFDSSAALVSNTTMMPVLGGTIVEFEDDELANYEIIGGFGGNYLLAERAGVQIASSDIPLFLADQTVFKGTARYDGRPLSGEAFVIVNYDNTDATTAADFPADYANEGLNDLTITAAAGSAIGKTVLTVSGTVAQSNPVLKYKLGEIAVKAGSTLPAGFETLTSGSTAITAAAGKKITVVELDADNRIVSAGVVISVPKAS
ncbi:MAG: phage major capsid protein [Clostridia bacterium]|nr:phage major capsid protein [Clostridia bacterium]